MKLILALFALLLAIFFLGKFSQNYFSTNQLLPFTSKSSVTVNEQKFNVSLADNDKERATGLSDTKSLSQNDGMLFIFDKPGYHTFWMKNMDFPIDIIFIKDTRIVTIHSDAQPIKTDTDSPALYKPEEPANMVLEINAGLAKKYNLKKGDEVKVDK